MRSAGFGLIGCGVWGEVHARTYAASPSAHLVAVFDRDQERGSRFAREFGAQTSYADLHDLLADPDIEAVAVATPDFAHTEAVLAALQAGKHVLVEKPLAMTVDDCKQILAARDANGVKLMVDFHNRWLNPFVHVRRMIESGELGSLLMINIRLNDTLYVPTKVWSGAPTPPPLHFLGSHVVDLVRWLSGAEVERVFSVSRSVVQQGLGIDTPDFYQSILELSNGRTAVIENCWIIAESAPNIFDLKGEFVGTKGSAFVDVSHHRMIEKYTQEGPALLDALRSLDQHGNPLGSAAIEHFIDSVVRDTAPTAPGEDGLEAPRVVEAMEISARSGHPVNL